MNKISDLKALEELKDKIALCSSEVAQQDAIKPLDIKGAYLSFPLLSVVALVAAGKAVAPAVRKEFRSVEKWNQIFNPLWKKHDVVEEIEITPQIVRFLADDHTVYAAKKAIVDKEDQKKWVQEAKIAGVAAYSALTGELSSVGVGIGNAVDRVNTYIASKKAYARILQERDQIARHVLSTYLVTEPEPGKYVLKRGGWLMVPKQTESMILQAAKGLPSLHIPDFIPQIQPVGFDTKIDLSKLPELPLLKDGPAK